MREIKEIKREESLIKLENKKTDLIKIAFINEIKNGLGDEIKEVGNRVEIKPKKKPNVIVRFFKKVFSI